jgi:hypothetical protein
MSSLSGSIHSYLSDSVNCYINQIPADTRIKMLQSLISGFIYAACYRGNPACAGWSVVAAAVYAASTPLFKNVLGDVRLSDRQELTRAGIAIITTGCIASLSGDSTVLDETILSLLTHWIRMRALETFSEGSTYRSLNHANILIA